MKADFELKFDMEQLVQPIQINDSTESQASLKIVKVEPAPAIKTQQKNNGNLKVQTDLTKQAQPMKFRETVRDKEQRRNMKGQSCFRCKNFYSALG